MKSYLLAAAFGILVSLHPFPAAAESAGSLVEAGNQAFSEGNYAAALENYAKASKSKPDSPTILFNQGDALYKQEKYDEAGNFFEQASIQALAENNPVLEAQSRYNLGNSSYRKAEKLLQEDPDSALGEFKRSGSYYKSALAIDPNFRNAAENLEASRVAAKQVEELIRRQQQKAQQQNALKQEMTQKLEKLQKEQQEAAANTQKEMQAGQQNENAKSTKNQAEQFENQKSITDRTKQAENKLADPGQDPNDKSPNDAAREHVKKAIEKQEEAEQNLQQRNLSDAFQNQQAASQELRRAWEKLQQDRDRKQEKDDSGQQSQEAAEKQQTEDRRENAQQNRDDTVEEQQNESSQSVLNNLEKISPEDIINEELENKKTRSIRGKTGYAPVEKDW